MANETTHRMKSADEEYMARALELAWRGRGWVNPNPMVGCVIVKDGQVLGEGWHTRFGCPHAEREALADCAARGNEAEGATVYVTLEPCAHFGKTPPCADALIEARVRRVVIGSTDPNPQVAGVGIQRMRKAGIEVVEGVLRESCDALNIPFFHWMTTGRPLVIAKYAMTLDGKIATRIGASQWITGEVARRRVHEDRTRFAAIMVGVGTVLADDPLLTARLDTDVQLGMSRLHNPFASTLVHQPMRIVCDTHLRTPLESALVRSTDIAPVYLATAVSDPVAHGPYKEAGCGIIYLKAASDGRIPLSALFQELGDLGIDSVIVEGGATLLGSAFDDHCVDRVQAYVAPKIFGGADAPSPVGGVGVALPVEATQFEAVTVESLGEDLLIEGAVCSQAS